MVAPLTSHGGLLTSNAPSYLRWLLSPLVAPLTFALKDAAVVCTVVCTRLKDAEAAPPTSRLNEPTHELGGALPY